MGRPFYSIGPKLTSFINWASGLPDFRAALPDSFAAQPAIVPPASMTSSGDEGRVMVDLRSAAESVARAGDEAAHDTPIQEIESLCMRCGKNVSTPVAYLSLPVVSFGSIQCVCSGF